MTRWLRGVAAVGTVTAAALVLSGCLGTGGSTSETPQEDAEGPLTIQSRLQPDAGEGRALQAVVDAFNEQGGGQVEINSVPNETFRDQLPSYLTSSNPPDVLTLYGGALTREFADEGLLLDLSDIWPEQGFSDALRDLSTDSSGNQVFIPTSYYWIGAYYKPSVWEAAGAEVPETWDELVAAMEALDAAGVVPVGMALSDAPWLTSAWFDYLNVRLNGREFHLDLLAGEESFEDPRVKAVLEQWNEILPYFDPEAPGLTFAQAVTDMANERTGMFLAGSWLEFSLPPDSLDEYAYFRFPVVDEEVPLVEGAPTDGFVASAGTDQPELAKEFLAYLASPEAQEIMYSADEAGTTIPANADAEVELSANATQGKEILESAPGGIIQWFNRDSSDALQETANLALTQYLAGAKPIDEILAEWQSEAERVRAG